MKSIYNALAAFNKALKYDFPDCFGSKLRMLGVGVFTGWAWVLQRAVYG